MPEYGKVLLNIALALATLLLTAVLWRNPLFLTALLILTGAAIFVIRPSRSSVIAYATGFVFGPVAEALAIHTGAWTYATSTVLGLPLWLPFLWGNAALFIQNSAELSKALFTKESSRARASEPIALDPRSPMEAQRRGQGDASVSRRETKIGGLSSPRV
jgi:hypothetical protein